MYAYGSTQSSSDLNKTKKKKRTKKRKLRKTKSAMEIKGVSSSKKRIVFKSSLTNTIRDVFISRGYKETKDEDWDYYWANWKWVRNNLGKFKMNVDQRLNHFANSKEMCRKDSLIKNIRRRKRELERKKKKKEAAKVDKLSPKTFFLPNEFDMWVNEMKGNSRNSLWICKPIGQGRGIFLVDEISIIEDYMKENKLLNKFQFQQPTRIIQKYITNPFLVGGKKFDMRLYALVTAFKPMKVYLYQEGFCRFSQSRFTLSNLGNKYIHLTNVAVQKKNKNYDSRGCKWMMRELRMYLESKFGEEKCNQVFVGIQASILRSLMTVKNVILHNKHCYELYGYDVLIDADLKTHILEINASPSLTASTKDDYVFKHYLLDDMVNVLEYEKAKNGSPCNHMGGFDLIANNDVKYNQKCNLGLFHNRKTTLPRGHPKCKKRRVKKKSKKPKERLSGKE